MKTNEKDPLSPHEMDGLPPGVHPGGFHRVGARQTVPECFADAEVSVY
ncbi:MAG: hypothetical protein ACQCXQ_06200 [Verrucomicrobiales bacterium]